MLFRVFRADRGEDVDELEMIRHHDRLAHASSSPRTSSAVNPCLPRVEGTSSRGAHAHAGVNHTHDDATGIPRGISCVVPPRSRSMNLRGIPQVKKPMCKFPVNPRPVA